MSSVIGRATSAAYGFFDRAWTAACWPLIGFLNLIFRPDPETGAVAWWKVAGWVIVNTALLSFAVIQLTWRDRFWVLVAFLVIHILIMMSSLRIMYEEKRVMEGSMKADAMRFSALDAVNDMSIMASSVVFYVAGLAALIQTIERSGMAVLLRHKPTLPLEYTEYLACVLNEVPILNSLMGIAANYLKYSDNVAAQIVYNGWQGNGIRILIVLTVSFIVVRALLLRFQQWSQQIAMAHGLETGTVSAEGVKKRLVRVPTTLNSHLMTSALTHPDTLVRKRALAAMAKLEVPHFARDFLMKLDNQLERDLGLAHIREACANMSASAREKLGGELAPILEKQLASIKDAIDMQTRARIEELKSMLKRA